MPITSSGSGPRSESRGTIGNRLGQANTLNDLGRSHRFAGNHAAAESLHRGALQMYQEIGHHLGETFTLYELGRLHEETGDNSTAMEMYESARTISRRSDIRLGEAVTCYTASPQAFSTAR
ncbi:tetratricopeptide repeat protein [Nocardia sp. NEAU-G5]|uniref:Tetratricopeptide repeat protein n=1 Tax=Nocardia albiluteola TaxID=2842303 RepID=A0ABS6B3Y9_9NOCA|nr:tetratricopeptide repeat protein [Nocardia albiluteola]MBU3063929.1 tetratricopeptide repeat protein [Nocardia albiluteola]